MKRDLRRADPDLQDYFASPADGKLSMTFLRIVRGVLLFVAACLGIAAAVLLVMTVMHFLDEPRFGEKTANYRDVVKHGLLSLGCAALSAVALLFCIVRK